MNYVGKRERSLITFNAYGILIVQISSNTFAIQIEKFQL